MTAPKPSDVFSKKSPAKVVNTESVKINNVRVPLPQKKPFVRKDHLSNRDLRNHDGLKQLQKTLANDDKKGAN